MKRAVEVVETVKKLGPNPYQDMFATWRLARTLSQLQAIGLGNLELEAWPAEVYLLRILTEILETLGPQDEFLVVTNLRFWNYAAPSGVLGEYSTGYLSAQSAALKRGMRLFRVFLLSKTQMAADLPRLETHRKFLRDAKEENAQIDVAYVELDDKEIEDAIHGMHFACIRRREGKDPLSSRDQDNGRLIVEPVYRGTRISSLRLVFSPGEPHEDANSRFYIDRFFQAALVSKSLEKL